MTAIFSTGAARMNRVACIGHFEEMQSGLRNHTR
jgi:hypothetical protein